jgi:dTDP-glucose pyrophosphorylase
MKMDKAKIKSLLIYENATIKQAMQKLNETAEKILFVVDEKTRLLGTVTDGDIRRGIINNAGFQDGIEGVIQREFTAIKQGIPEITEYAKQMMVKRKIEQLPVLDENNVIVDVMLWTDFLGGEVHLKTPTLKQNYVVIMAGGKGMRLDPFTKILPKPLIPIGNKTVIELIMERFYKYGFHNFVYTLNYKKDYLKLYLKENNFPYSIEWVEEPDFLGTAGSLTLLQDKLKDTFFVVNCDSLLDSDFEEILKWHKENNAAMTIIGCHNEVKIPFGVLELSNGRLERILEKPVHDVIINTGIYVMEPHVISCIPKDRKVDMNEVIDLISEKEKVSVYPISTGWFDIGQWDEYRKSLKLLSDSEYV